MAEKKQVVDREQGPYMIQDHDHMSGQMGGKTERTGRQAQQSAADPAQHNSGQQGGEKSHRRSKLL